MGTFPSFVFFPTKKIFFRSFVCFMCNHKIFLFLWWSGQQFNKNCVNQSFTGNEKESERDEGSARTKHTHTQNQTRLREWKREERKREDQQEIKTKHTHTHKTKQGYRNEKQRRGNERLARIKTKHTHTHKTKQGYLREWKREREGREIGKNKNKTTHTYNSWTIFCGEQKNCFEKRNFLHRNKDTHTHNFFWSSFFFVFCFVFTSTSKFFVFTYFSQEVSQFFPVWKNEAGTAPLLNAAILSIYSVFSFAHVGVQRLSPLLLERPWRRLVPVIALVWCLHIKHIRESLVKR